MTFILALGNRDQCIQISDRKLVTPSGQPTIETNKVGVLRCEDARLLFGFTGIARYGNFRTERWLLDTLLNCGSSDCIAADILERLRERATRDFETLPALQRLSRTEEGLGLKRLGLMFSGYLYRAAPPLQVYAIITNYQDIANNKESPVAWGEFKATAWWEKRPAEAEITFIQRIGMWPAMANEDERLLRTLLSQRKPAKAIVDKSIEIVREIADRPQAKGKIGKDLSSIIMPSNGDSTVVVGYHANENRYKVFHPALVIVTKQLKLAIGESSIEAQEPQSSIPLVVPKVGRNTPCPCKSGKKYKFCHGR